VIAAEFLPFAGGNVFRLEGTLEHRVGVRESTANVIRFQRQADRSGLRQRWAGTSLAKEIHPS